MNGAHVPEVPAIPSTAFKIGGFLKLFRYRIYGMLMIVVNRSLVRNFRNYDQLDSSVKL